MWDDQSHVVQCLHFLVFMAVLLMNCGLRPTPHARASNEDDLEAALTLLKSDDPFDVGRGMTMVRQFGHHGAPAVPILIEKLSDTRQVEQGMGGGLTIQVSATMALMDIGKPAVPALTTFITRSRNDKATVQAIKVLYTNGVDADVSIEAILRCTQADDEAVRFHAIETLVKVARDPSKMVPRLFCALDDESPEVKSAAVRGLGCIGPRAASTIPKLLLMLDSEERRSEWPGWRPLRADVADTLGRIGTCGEDVVEKLAMLMRQNDKYVSIAAACAHCKLSEDKNVGLTVLSKAMKDRSRGYGTVVQAAKAAGDLGPHARQISGQLVSLLNDEEPSVRRVAAEAIATIRPLGYFGHVAECCKDQDELVRSFVFRLLGRNFADEPRVVGLLISGLDDESAIARASAIHALGRLGRKAEKAVSRLRDIANSGDTSEEDSARKALDLIQSDDEEVQERGTR